LAQENAGGGTIDGAHRIAAVQHTVGATAPAAQQTTIEQPQHPHLLAAAWGDEQRPAAAVGEIAQVDGDGLFDVAELDEEFSRFGADYALGAEARDADGWEVIGEASVLRHD
jgi:hypothetical protein